MSEMGILFNQVPLLVNVELACILGLNESIVLQQVHYWVEKNKKEGRNLKDGYIWTYNTYSDWQEQFPFWSDSTIKRIFSKLEKMGLLVSAKYNKKSFDRTKWYRIDYEVLNNLLNGRCSQNDTMGNSGDSTDELVMTQDEILSEDNRYEARNVRVGQNDPMIDVNLTQLTVSNCPDYKCQIDPLKGGNLTRPIPETNYRDYTENSSSSSNAYQIFEKEFGRPLSPFERDTLYSWLETFSEEIIIHALKIAVLGQNRSFRYIQGILTCWQGEGVRCIRDVELLEQRHQAEKQKRTKHGKRISIAEHNKQVLERLFDAEK